MHGAGSAKLQGIYVVLERYLGGLSHIEKPFEGGGGSCLKLYIISEDSRGSPKSYKSSEDF